MLVVSLFCIQYFLESIVTVYWLLLPQKFTCELLCMNCRRAVQFIAYHESFWLCFILLFDNLAFDAFFALYDCGN